ncbi:hypothetical protein GCM10009547_26010 [Sporichthya brevicatena]|uniref:Collagen triple helix repeat protein n=1 Tax=Sporichthya brevicatena TaxID=171442 RepID=A0ABN1GWQ4_9ACTN
MRINSVLRGATVFGAAAVIGVAGMQIANASPTVNAGAGETSASETAAGDTAAAGKRGPRGPRGYTGPRGPVGPAGPSLVSGQFLPGANLPAGRYRAEGVVNVWGANTFSYTSVARTLRNFVYVDSAQSPAGVEINIAVDTTPLDGPASGVTTYKCATEPTLTGDFNAAGATCSIASISIPAGAIWYFQTGGATDESGDFFSYTIS